MSMNFYESKKWPKIFSEYFYKLDEKISATWTEELFNGPKKIYNLTDEEVCEALYTFVDDRDRPKILKLTHLRTRIFRQRGSQSRALNLDRLSAKIGYTGDVSYTPVLDLKKKIVSCETDDEIWDVICTPNDDEICAHLEGYAKSVHPDFDPDAVRQIKVKEFSKSIHTWLNKSKAQQEETHKEKIAKMKEQLKIMKERDDTTTRA